MTSASPQKPPGTNLSTRFLKPETAVAERIDQLTLAHPDEQDLRQSREQQASWLKRAMAIHWNGDLPQPFIGFDLSEGLFVAEWQSDTECHTLTIDAENRKAWYDPWSPDASGRALPEEIDLNQEEGWACLKNVLTGTRP
jgi:hypothetical protein